MKVGENRAVGKCETVGRDGSVRPCRLCAGRHILCSRRAPISLISLSALVPSPEGEERSARWASKGKGDQQTSAQCCGPECRFQSGATAGPHKLLPWGGDRGTSCAPPQTGLAVCGLAAQSQSSLCRDLAIVPHKGAEAFTSPGEETLPRKDCQVLKIWAESRSSLLGEAGSCMGLRSPH